MDWMGDPVDAVRRTARAEEKRRRLLADDHACARMLEGIPAQVEWCKQTPCRAAPPVTES